MTPTKPPDSLSGLIERVTFFNEETGFAVLRVKVKGHRDLVTVVGSLPAVSAGEWLTAEGHWVRDKDHGLQLRATLLKATPPTTREGIEKYLGSGLVKGIGPVYAKKLVATFGERIFEIIENFSARLEEVEGIGQARRRRIKAAWAAQKHVREIMVFLHSHGVSTSKAVRIFKTYGESAVERVRANPYVLSRDIHGIGFKSADAIAQRIGIPSDSLMRATAGLQHVLGEAIGAGNCALPELLLIEKATDLLKISEGIVIEALSRSLAANELVRDPLDGAPLIFLPALRIAEEGIAAKLQWLAAQKALYPSIDVEAAIAWCEARTGKRLASAQRDALVQALANRVIVITGGPGVGKTTLLNSLLLILRAKKVKCLLCAPTGRAAKRLTETTSCEARTIHRLLEVQPHGRGFARNETNPLECDTLVVDETSMVDVPLMHALLRALPLTASVVLVGDVDQLPSVGPGNVLRDIIESGVVPVARLNEVFRQADASRIVTAAHAINRGEVPEIPSRGDESDFFFIERAEPDAIATTLVELVKTRIPRKLGCDAIKDVQVLAPMNRGSLGVRELNARLQSELNPSREDEPCVEKFGTPFRLRDKVIQTENDYDKDVFNGDVGYITAIDPIEQELKVRFDDREVAYEFGELDELALAYAITIHKSQGSEFPAVVIPLATQQYMLLQRNLVYTGVTRGRRFVVIVGQKRALAMAVSRAQTRQRCSGLLARLTRGSVAG